MDYDSLNSFGRTYLDREKLGSLPGWHGFYPRVRAEGAVSHEIKKFEPIDPFWRIHPFLILRDAAALLAGYSPEQVGQEVRTSHFPDTFKRYAPAISALVGAVLSMDLPADIVREGSPNGPVSHTSTRVRTADLRTWLTSVGYTEGFFFPQAKPQGVPYLDETHPRFSPKLAAAVRAWQAMDDENLMRGKSPRTAMADWMRSRYRELGLAWNGAINKSGINEAAKVANWDDKGGAPKTPGK